MSTDSEVSKLAQMGTVSSKLPTLAWKRGSALAVNADKRSIKLILNKINKEQISEYVDKIVDLLRKGECMQLKFLQEYFLAIWNYKADPTFQREFTDKRNPMIELYPLHLSKVLKKYMKESPYLCLKMKETLFEMMLGHIRADFTDIGFEHNLKSAHYVAIAMHAAEQILSVKQFSMVCIIATAVAVTPQQQLAAYELVHNGWTILPQQVLKLVTSHMSDQLSTMKGRESNCYLEMVKLYAKEHSS